MERIIDLFGELQKELIAFVEKTNRQLSTPRCDFSCGHCNWHPPRKENYEEFTCSNMAITPDDHTERFEQSELKISEVIGVNYGNNPSRPQRLSVQARKDDRKHTEHRSRVFLMSTETEVPEEMTISESSFNMDDEEEEDDDDDDVDYEDEENEISTEFIEENDDVDDEKLRVEEDAGSRSLPTEDAGNAEDPIDKRRCKFCDKVFPFPYLVKRHEGVHTGARPFKCLGCRLTFPIRADLEAHHSQCQIVALTCRECGIRHRDAKKLKLHIAHAHGRDGPSRPQRLSVQAKKSKADKNDQPINKDKQPTKANMKSRSKRKLKCQLCNRICSNNSAFLKHMAAHSAVKRFKCTDCGKKYTYKERLNQHVQKCHAEKPMPAGAVKKKTV